MPWNRYVICRIQRKQRRLDTSCRYETRPFICLDFKSAFFAVGIHHEIAFLAGGHHAPDASGTSIVSSIGQWIASEVQVYWKRQLRLAIGPARLYEKSPTVKSQAARYRHIRYGHPRKRPHHWDWQQGSSLGADKSDLRLQFQDSNIDGGMQAVDSDSDYEPQPHISKLKNF